MEETTITITKTKAKYFTLLVNSAFASFQADLISLDDIEQKEMMKVAGVIAKAVHSVDGCIDPKCTEK